MRILCIDANYPGRLGLLAGYLARQGHELLFASRHSRKDFSLPQVKRVILKCYGSRPVSGQDAGIERWRQTVTSGSLTFGPLSTLGADLQPDMVLSTLLDGAAFFATQALPHAFHVFYATLGGFSGPELHAMIAVQSLCVLQSHKAFVFTEGDRSRFAPVLWPLLEPVCPWVDTEALTPALARPCAPEGSGEWVSVRMQGLPRERERATRRLVLGLLLRRPRCHVFLDYGESGGGKTLWLQRLPEELRHRIHAGGRQELALRRDLLHASFLHIIPGATPATRMARLEAMSCGALLMAPPLAEEAEDTAVEYPGKTMLALPAEAAQQLAAVTDALDHQREYAAVRAAARAAVCARFSPEVALPRHAARLMECYERFRHA